MSKISEYYKNCAEGWSTSRIKNEIKELFTYKPDTISETHDLLNCRCSKQTNKIPLHKRQAASVDELASWDHYDNIAKVPVCLLH